MIEYNEQPLTSHFEQVVARYPDKLAIKSKHLKLTYHELNQAANQMARAILTNCVAGNEVVALVAGYGTHEIIGLLGVLKAGKALVGIPSSYPIIRSSYILAHSRASLIVTDNDNLALARELATSGLPVINMEKLDPNMSDENLGLSISSETIAAIVYTSGTSGQPKGVIQNHRNLTHAIWRTSNRFQICENDRDAILSSYAFLAGMVSILRDLLNGACIYPFNIKEEGIDKFINILMEEEITVLGCNPTTFRHLVGCLCEEKILPSIRLLYLVGEVLYPKDVELYKKHFAHDCLFVNLLGCTEIPSICSYIMDKEIQIKTRVVPVGYEFDGQQVLLLNGEGDDVGLNHVGEVVIKSSYLSPGYLGQPELTQAAFLDDPTGGNMRLYRTGDLGIRLPDGCILHLGRKDSQVKIRGYRIEVAEIEAALQTLDGVKEVAVVAQEDQNDEQILVGYVVPARQPAPSISTLRRGLIEKLPDYMIPSAFVTVDALPLTQTGKVDYRALPLPSQIRPNLDRTFMAPRDHREQLLADIWAKVLGIDAIGIEDNFFELGGNSLLAARLIVQTENAFGRKLPLAAIFQRPTVKQFARILNGEVQFNARSSPVPIQTDGSNWPFFCIAGGEQLAGLARYLGSEQPVYEILPHWYNMRTSFTVEQIATDCLEEIRALQPEGPYFLGGHSFGGLVAFEMAHQLQTQGQKVGLLVLIDTYPSLLNKSIQYYLHRLRYKMEHGQLVDSLVSKVKLTLPITPADARNQRHWAFIRVAMDNYELRAYFGRIVFFAASERPAPSEVLKDTRLDWANVAKSELETYLIPGDHCTMLKEPNLRILAERLKACLDESASFRGNETREG